MKIDHIKYNKLLNCYEKIIKNVFLLGAVVMGSMMFGMTSCSDDDNENGGVMENGHRKFVSNVGGVNRYVVQLCKGGPYFAEFNVGATIRDYGSVQDWSVIKSVIMADDASKKVDITNENQQKLFSYVGNYFSWGATSQYITNDNPGSPYYNSSGYICPFSILPDSADVARQVWGSNWHMPDTASLARLAKKRWNGSSFENDPNPVVDTFWCDGSIKKFARSSIPGMMFRGKGDYVRDSIFFPVAGSCCQGNFYSVGSYSSYRYSVPYGSSCAWGLYVNDSMAGMYDGNRSYGHLVRAVAK